MIDGIFKIVKYPIIDSKRMKHCLHRRVFLHYDGNMMLRKLTKDGLHLLPQSYKRCANKIALYILE